MAGTSGVVWHAHQNGFLNAAQAGSRPHHTSIDVVTSEEHKYLNSKLTRQAMATMDNEAKSCYDQIVASLTLLISNHFGVPEEVCNTVGELYLLCSLNFAQHSVTQKNFTVIQRNFQFTVLDKEVRLAHSSMAFSEQYSF